MLAQCEPTTGDTLVEVDETTGVMKRSSVELHVVVRGESPRGYPMERRGEVVDGFADARDILVASEQFPQAKSWTLVGADIVSRPDLLTFLQALSSGGAPNLGIVTSGQLLGSTRSLERLRIAGLKRIRVPIYSVLPDAHDWCADQPGASRMAWRCLRAAQSSDLEVEAVCTITRPTVSALPRTVEALAKFGVQRLYLQFIQPTKTLGDRYVSLVPRIALAEPYIEESLGAAVRMGIKSFIVGMPQCAVGRCTPFLLRDDSVRWVSPSAIARNVFRDPMREERIVQRCPTCPGDASCSGIESTYLQLFGWDEHLQVARPSDGRESFGFLLGGGNPRPRTGRAPSTKVADVVRISRKLAKRSKEPAQAEEVRQSSSIRVHFGSPSGIACPTCGDHELARLETTREIRKRLVRASSEGATTLRITGAGSLAHPQIAELLRETTRLSFQSVEVSGNLAPLDRLTDAEIRRLAGITRFDAALLGSTAQQHDEHAGSDGAFEATRSVLERLRKLSRAALGVYAVIHELPDLDAFRTLWREYEFPGQPTFRLALKGGRLSDLATLAHGAKEEIVQTLARILPPCLQPIETDMLESIEPLFLLPDERIDRGWGLDRLAASRRCPHHGTCVAATRCTGIPVGWDEDGIQPL